MKFSMVNSQDFFYDELSPLYTKLGSRSLNPVSDVTLDPPFFHKLRSKFAILNYFFISLFIFLFFKTIIIWVFGVRKTIGLLSLTHNLPFPPKIKVKIFGFFFERNLVSKNYQKHMYDRNDINNIPLFFLAKMRNYFF